jgi:hypothetical protein
MMRAKAIASNQPTGFGAGKPWILAFKGKKTVRFISILSRLNLLARGITVVKNQKSLHTVKNTVKNLHIYANII